MKSVLPQAFSLVVLAAAASAQVPAGPEFQVNTYTTTRQFGGRLAMEPDGDFVIVWSSIQDGSVTGVFGQRFAATGAPRGGEFRVNTFTPQNQTHAAVAVGRRGDFVVVWDSDLQDGSSRSVQGQRYDSAGTTIGGEFRVNTYTTGAQANPSVSFASDGRFVVAWTSNGADGDADGIAARRFDPSGNPIGDEFVVNPTTAGFQISGTLAVEADGDFVAVWEDSTGDGSGPAIVGQRYGASGARLGGEFRVNTYTTGQQTFPSISISPAGGFVVAWMSDLQDGDASGMFARRYDAAGDPIGDEFQVNTYTTSGQWGAWQQVAHDALGNFVIAWHSVQDGSSWGTFGQRYTASGARRGAEFRVNTYVTGPQLFPAIASDAVGNFVVAWESDQQDGNNYGVFARRFGGLFPDSLRADVPGDGILEPGDTASIRPSWRNETGAPQSITSTLTQPGGPANGVPQIIDGVGGYGTIAAGVTAECISCYVVQIPAPATRPERHWDASAMESLAPDPQGQQKRWLLHVGDSFTDVPRASGFYRFVETLLHHVLTGGCGATTYCPGASTIREHMAVFVLRAKEGAEYVPPGCGVTPMFGDVPASSLFCPWIEELARRGVVSGCGGGNYCPTAPVSREQMAVFVLRTLDPALGPPACTTPIYNDVPASSGFCRWIEELTRRSVVSGCGNGNYCPADPVTREQMAVFISVTFGLTLYGP